MPCLMFGSMYREDGCTWKAYLLAVLTSKLCFLWKLHASRGKISDDVQSSGIISLRFNCSESMCIVDVHASTFVRNERLLCLHYRVSTEFLALMKKVTRSPLVMDVVNIANVQKQLERLSDLLGKIQKALGEYLERERASFPR